MKAWLLGLLKPDSLGRWVTFGFYRNPITFSVAILRSLIATKHLTGSFFPLKVRIGAGQTLKITVGKNAKIFLRGNLLVNSWGGSNSPSSLACASGSRLTINGDFEIGPNVHIILMKEATLKIGGKLNSSSSGITCDTRIMVEDSICIGSDCIIAWDVFISDSNWHEISGVTRCSPVLIGDHVWISHGVSVLKGVVIPPGCIVGAKSLVSSVFGTDKALLAGVPAIVVRSNVEWTR
jgi:carbonic anhydrase/acetyltransferase-like protein (isoleucine patch superfamily)